MNIFLKALASAARHAQRNKRAIVTATIAGALVYPAARPVADLTTSVVEALSAYSEGDRGARDTDAEEGVK